MIQANELRIGNWITATYVPDQPFDLEVIELKPRTIDGLDESKYKAIEITEQWLRDLGFEKTRFDTFFIRFFGIEKAGEESWGAILKEDYTEEGKRVTHFTPLSEMKYVHQLQNLFYAVMGQELTIKESATEP